MAILVISSIGTWSKNNKLAAYSLVCCRENKVTEEQSEQYIPIIDDDLEEDISQQSDEDFFSGKKAPRGERASSILEVIESYGTTHPLLDLAIKQAHDAQFPASTAILVALTSFSSTLGLSCCTTYPNGSKMPLGIYFIGEQPPSSAKSRLLNFFNSPVQEAISELNKKRFKHNSEFKKANKEKLDPESEGMPIIKVLSGNITPEALEQKHCNSNLGYFSLASAEQGLPNTFLGLTRGIDRSNDNDLLLKAFNGEFHSSERITRSGFSGLVHGSFLCIAQDGSINTILTQSQSTGLAERFILYVEPNMLGERNFTTHEAVTHESEVYAYEEAIVRLVNKIDELPNKAPALKDLRVLKLSDSSWLEIRKFRDSMEPLIADGAKYSHSIMRGFVGKLDIQVMKIAATLHGSFHALESESGNIPETISSHWVNLALKMFFVCIERVYLLLHEMEIIGLSAQESSILQLFQSKNRPLNMREITQSRIKVNPFKSMSSNKTEAVRHTVDVLLIKNEIHQVHDLRNAKVKYSL